MKEGSLEAPTRHSIPWEDPEFTNEEAIDKELRRVFDICHGCRRCFNLCDSFPTLFDLIDDSESMELDSVDSKDFPKVVDACTLCDMCFMVKCPYVPPHSFDVDFPHLMLRHRAAEHKRGEVKFVDKAMADTDAIGHMGTALPGMTNWALKEKNKITRPLMEKVTGVDRRAALPKYTGETLVLRAKKQPLTPVVTAPSVGRKAVIYATCTGNYNVPSIGLATREILAKNGVEVEVVYPGCCGMPFLEQGDIKKVSEKAIHVAEDLNKWVDKGYDVIALVPSCALMMKFEWPLILPDDASVKKLSKATYDVTEYIIDLHKTKGLAPGIEALEGGVSLHLACHSRAQNMGAKAADMLRLIPNIDLQVIERCSGHGGAWGVKKKNFDIAIKTGKPVVKQVQKGAKQHLASECPLAGMHIVQGLEMADEKHQTPKVSKHPIELFAQAYGIEIKVD